MAKSQAGRLPNFSVNVWGGLNTSVKNKDDMTPGQSPDSLNWITGAAEKDGKFFGDHIEIRRGTSILQETLSDRTDPITGLAVGIKKDGTQVPIFTAGRSICYYDASSNALVGLGVDVLPLKANGEDVSVIPYDNFSGYYVYISSPNSSIYKIALPNPNNIIDFSSLEYRGCIGKAQSRLELWNRQGLTSGKNLNDLFLSAADGTWATINSAPNTAPFSQVLKVVKNATNGTDKTFTGTVAPANNKQSLFNVQAAAPVVAGTAITAITQASGAYISSVNHGLAVGDVGIIDGVVGMTEINNLIVVVIAVDSANTLTVNVESTTFTPWSSGGTIYKCEYFLDDGNGLMASQSGGTGTINYITGDYSLTFNTAPINAKNIIFAYLQIQDDDKGILDFVPTSGTIVAGDPSVFAQPGMGQLMNIMSLSGIFFCFHQFGVYQLGITDNDVTKASQQEYRLNAGIPYYRAAYTTGDGIIFLDTLKLAAPKLRMLVLDFSLSSTNPAIIPKSISEQLDLSSYGWDRAVVKEWGDYYVLCGKGTSNGVIDSNNNLMFLYNKNLGSYDKLDFRANCLDDYYGALLSGDSISSNPLVLFSGFDDLGYNINNYWKSSDLLLGWKGMKKFNRLRVKGLIQSSQNLEIWLSFDGGQYTLWKTVGGNSEYVNKGVPMTVGGPVMGSNIVGGGGMVSAYPYEADFQIGSDLFERVSFMVKGAETLDENGVPITGTGVGYLSVDEIIFEDIRMKSSRPIHNIN